MASFVFLIDSSQDMLMYINKTKEIIFRLIEEAKIKYEDVSGRIIEFRNIREDNNSINISTIYDLKNDYESFLYAINNIKNYGGEYGVNGLEALHKAFNLESGDIFILFTNTEPCELDNYKYLPCEAGIDIAYDDLINEWKKLKDSSKLIFFVPEYTKYYLFSKILNANIKYINKDINKINLKLDIKNLI